MNIQLMRLRPVVRELRQIRSELARIADCMETDLQDRNITIPRTIKPTTDPPELFVTDEEMDYIRELEDEEARLKGRSVEPDV